jgi:hypothetical protein
MTPNREPERTPAVTIVNPLDLDSLALDKGAHDPGAAMCVMEAVAYVAGEEWSDHPKCASPVISAFMRSWNDALPEADRNRLLKPYVLRLVGTAATAEVEEVRAWMCLDWLVRVHTPAWLRLAGLSEQADRLAGLPEFRAGVDVSSVRPAIDAGAAAVAGVAAWDAVGPAAWDAAWDAAWAAAWAAAARDAADAAVAAVVARDAAWDAALTAARDAARDAAWDAALTAARAAAWAAAGAAARARLQPVVDELQSSALALIDRMIDVE